MLAVLCWDVLADAAHFHAAQFLACGHASKLTSAHWALSWVGIALDGMGVDGAMSH